MSTVSEILQKLKQEGYTVDFNLEDNCLVCHGNALRIYPEEFTVDKHYRFEGLSDPGDEAVVYAISSDKHQLKGALVDGYGIYSDGVSGDLMKKLQVNSSSATAEPRNTAPFEKNSEATAQRPEGDRVLEATLVEMDLPELIARLKAEPTWKTNDRNAITLYKSSSLRLVLIALHPGAELKTHTAPGTISVQVLQGRIKFSAVEKTLERREGQLLTLQAGVPHSVLAQEESVFLLTMSLPVGKA